MNLAVCCPSTGLHEEAVQSWVNRAHRPWVGAEPRFDHQCREEEKPNVRTVEWDSFSITVDDTIEGIGAGYLHKVEKFYRESTADVLAYLHSDLFIHSHGWDEMVLREFETCEVCGRPEFEHAALYPNIEARICDNFTNRVAIVSFCGARRHGHPDIYKAPYDYRQLARFEFISNLVDAEKHGQRVLKPQDVAVVDSFSLIVRRSFLDLIRGWPINHECHIYDDLWEPCRCCGYHCRVCNQRWYRAGIKPGTEIGEILQRDAHYACEGFPVRPTYHPSHCSDYWLCLMAHRHKMRIRYVPVSCTHNSGGVRGDGRFDYAKWQEWYGFTDAQMHQINHRLLYDEFRDVLPVRIP